jgi:hypothetical protein
LSRRLRTTSRDDFPGRQPGEIRGAAIAARVCTRQLAPAQCRPLRGLGNLRSSSPGLRPVLTSQGVLRTLRRCRDRAVRATRAFRCPNRAGTRYERFPDARDLRRNRPGVRRLAAAFVPAHEQLPSRRDASSAPRLPMGGRSSPLGPKAAAEPPHSKARYARLPDAAITRAASRALPMPYPRAGRTRPRPLALGPRPSALGPPRSAQIVERLPDSAREILRGKTFLPTRAQLLCTPERTLGRRAVSLVCFEGVL